MRASARILFVFGIFLIVCGVLGWASAGFSDRAKTAVLSGAGSGALILVSGFLANGASRTMQAIGAHAGMGLALLFGGTFVWRAIVAWQDVSSGEPKTMTASLLSAMAVAALVSLALLVKSRPATQSA
jgi:hypothetical membrane protein